MIDDEQNELFLAAGPTDEYRLAGLDFQPDVIYDIGADVGSITMFAHDTFPSAKIVAVEPNPGSYERLVQNAAKAPEIVPVHAALGRGQMYGPKDAEPLHSLVVDKEAATWSEDFVPAAIRSVTLAELYAEYGGENYVVKVDIESAEYSMLIDPSSVMVIRRARYFAAEFHIWADQDWGVPKVAEVQWKFLFDLAKSHNIDAYCHGACIHLWAVLRTEGNTSWLKK